MGDRAGISPLLVIPGKIPPGPKSVLLHCSKYFPLIFNWLLRTHAVLS